MGRKLVEHSRSVGRWVAKDVNINTILLTVLTVAMGLIGGLLKHEVERRDAFQDTIEKSLKDETASRFANTASVAVIQNWRIDIDKWQLYIDGMIRKHDDMIDALKDTSDQHEYRIKRLEMAPPK